MEVEMFFNISNVYLYFRLLTVFCEVAKSKVVIYVILYAVLLFFLSGFYPLLGGNSAHIINISQPFFRAI